MKTTIKIALSASFYNVKAVQDVLHGCDRIYTTQVRNLPEIFDLFGEEKVRALPDGCNSTMDWVKARETQYNQADVTVEFVTFGDLMRLSQVANDRAAILEEELKTQEMLIESLRKEILSMQEDQRRLNYLVTQSQYENSGGLPTHTWSVTGTGLQGLRDVLDLRRAGLAYTPDNKPIAQSQFNRSPSAPMLLSAALTAAVASPCQRDPMDQDHSVEASSGVDYRGESK